MIEIVIAWAAREAAGWWYKRRARAELERQFRELAERARLAEYRLSVLLDGERGAELAAAAARAMKGGPKS